MELYECSTKGDRRFSALVAYVDRFKCTIEYGYQVVIKGYDSIKEGKGNPPKVIPYEVAKYKYELLWQYYLMEHPELVEDLLEITKDHVLNDMFAKPNSVNQAEALTSIINKIRKGELKMARKSMNEVKDAGNTITKPGTYEMEIIKVEEKLSSEGTPISNITLESEEGICWDRLVQTEKALGFTKRYLSACGYDMDDLDYDVVEKGKKKGQVTKYYLTDENGDEEEYTLDQLLLEEVVLVTLKEGDKTYHDKASGQTITKDNPGVKVASIQAVEDEEE